MLLTFVSEFPASGLPAGTEGTFDGSFGANGVAMVPLPFMVPGSVTVDAQGRVVVSGFGVENQVSSLVVARYTSAGHLDPSFGTSGIARIGSRPVSDALAFGRSAIAPDGRIFYDEARSGTIVAFDRKTGKTETIKIPTPGSIVRNMSVDSTRSRIWLALSGTGRIGKIELK